MGDGLDVTLLPASVSPLVAAAVSGRARPCRVLAAFPTCVYLDLGAHDRVLAVLAADAVALPIGLHLTARSEQVSWGVEPGHEVVVGAGRVHLPGLDIVAARIRRPERVRPAPWAASRSGLGTLLTARHDPELTGHAMLAELAHELASNALAGRPVDEGVRGLVGAGRGLTPSGDDVLCGVLLTLAAVDDERASRALAALRTSVGACVRSTTSLSAALLVAAATGYAVPDVVRLVTLAVAGGSSDRPDAHEPASEPAHPAQALSPDPAAVLDRVQAIGHSSGRDLVSGVAGALRALDESLDPTHKGARRG
ncbi:hypothetical protein GCM10027053_33730 [Intrasporangium mesophilum]